MEDFLSVPVNLIWLLYENLRAAPLPLLLLLFVTLLLGGFALVYVALFILAPIPRLPYPSEKSYITSTIAGTSPLITLPCWYDSWLSRRLKRHEAGDFSDKDVDTIEEAEIAMSVVVPAYNEEERLEGMLVEAVEYLDAEYGRPSKALEEKQNGNTTGMANGIHGESVVQQRGKYANGDRSRRKGYEIILVNDGSRDKTVEVALKFSREHQLHDILRIVTLRENRGKGGAVTHGFRHVRGEYAIFADADGASKFSNLGDLVEGCKTICDEAGRGVALGSRAHLVDSEAVVKRSLLRNALMHSFHVLLRILTPPATSRIGDTQCGFKLFSRAALPHIIPYMHAEGWIFDVEMLMLAESAPSPGVVRTYPGIKVAEVPIGWKEVGGSKLNVIWDSISMAWGLAILRAGWAFGVYRRQ